MLPKEYEKNVEEVIMRVKYKVEEVLTIKDIKIGRIGLGCRENV